MTQTEGLLRQTLIPPSWRSLTLKLTAKAAGLSTESREEANACERLLARSFYRELCENGYTPKELLAISIELIDLVTKDLPERID
jgi:hypothetical protein